MNKKDVVVLGATGVIGQQFVRLLADHPKFNITHLYASDRSEGKRFSDLWKLPSFDCPEDVSNIVVDNIDDVSNNLNDFEIAFSGLPKSIADQLEIDLRNEGKFVFSNAGSHRMNKDVPILIPEINGDHIQLVDSQRDNNKSDGFIVTNSNCSAAGAAIYLYEVNKIHRITTAIVTTYQALSGAGLDGVSSLDIIGNVIPYISSEEPKIVEETKKILGTFHDGQIQDHGVHVIANAARVHVTDGHLEAITAFFDQEIPENFKDNLSKVDSPLNTSNYHIAPKSHLNIFTDPDRPQPRLDVFRSDGKSSTRGMTVHAGRLRQNTKDLSAYVLSHNTIRGGAGGSVLNAEFAINKGYI